MLRIATTVGTSLLENYRQNGGPAYGTFLDKIEDRPASDYQHFNAEIEQHLKGLKSFIIGNPSESSAELKSCKMIIEKYKMRTTVFLVATDTLASVIAAEAIDVYLNTLKDKPPGVTSIFLRGDNKHVVPGLQVKDETKFKTHGLQNLMTTLYYFMVEGIPPKFAGDRVINITGGFKGLIPYLTIFAQLKGFPINYTFEGTETLIDIPPLPIGFESALAEKYSYMLFHKNSLDQEALAELIKLGFLDSNNKTTALASLLTDYEVESLPTSINVLGLVIEYKLMEYYSGNPLPGYSNIERGNIFLAGKNPNNPPKGAEIDLVLKKSKNEINATSYIAIECKSAKSLQIKFDKVKDQLEKKLELMKTMGAVPDEIHFMLYTFPERKVSIDKIISRVDTNNLRELVQTVNKRFPGKPTRFFMARFDLNSVYDNDNPYQSFINQKLIKKENFKEIIIGEKNV